MNDPPSLQEASAVRLGASVRRLQQHLAPHLMSQMAGEMQDYELSFSQMGSLFQLRAQGQLTVSALGERAHLSLSAASQLVERLVRRGLLERREDPDNRRQKLVMLSAKGRDVLERFERITAAAYATVLADVPPAVLTRADESLREVLAHLPPSRACPAPEPEPAPERESA